MFTYSLLPMKKISLFAAVFVLAACATPAEEPMVMEPEVTAQTAATQADITPAMAIQMLKDGNQRFVAGDQFVRDLSQEVATTAAGQYPYAVVLGCIDSRVPPEIVFDAGIGDIFSARVAGNFENEDILGSMEFATAVAGSKAIVVLGHSECGAVKGACDNVEVGNITTMLANITPAVNAVEMEGDRSSANKAFVDEVVHMNVTMTMADILERSDIIREQVESGEVALVGAIHDVTTGQVTFLQ